jgi:hypothetical protein
MSTCNRLHLQTLGSQPVMPKLKISPITGLQIKLARRAHFHWVIVTHLLMWVEVKVHSCDHLDYAHF